MAASTRHLHRQNLREAKNNDFGDEKHDGDSPRGLAPPNRHHRRPQPPSSLQQSSAVLDALSNAQSKLARFLFVGSGTADGGDGTEDTWMSSLRRNSLGGNDNNMPSMRSWDAGFLALTLEPMEIRNERIIMLFEAYALFGALFMNGVWIMYEWGSWKGYGGDGTNLVVERIFECFMALALGGNVLLALWGAMYWMNAINLNASHEDYVFESMQPLVYLQILLFLTAHVLFFGLLLGVYLNLSPNWPETIVVLSILAAVVTKGMVTYSRHQMACASLEIYHFPLRLRMAMPHYWLRSEREKLIPNAKARAQKLKKRAYLERKRLDPNFEARSNRSATSIGVLLRTAAINLGMADYDVSIFEARLREDWFNDASQLSGRSIECLSRYMPLRLAEEVHKLVEANGGGTKEG